MQENRLQRVHAVLGQQPARIRLFQNTPTSHQPHQVGVLCLLNRVDAHRRLVQYQQRRLVNERGGQRNAPHLSAAALSHKVVLIWEVEKVDEKGRPGGGAFGVHAIKAGKVLQRLADGQVGVEANLLGHVADAGARNGRPPGARPRAKNRNGRAGAVVTYQADGSFRPVGAENAPVSVRCGESSQQLSITSSSNSFDIFPVQSMTGGNGNAGDGDRLQDR
ncbi:hypothetical protein TYRP_011604 [Tyrophagus putrescentiae]|nr:hypothetical protein TYRP_011604 [Tyrophagus putrescentiae]